MTGKNSHIFLLKKVKAAVFREVRFYLRYTYEGWRKKERMDRAKGENLSDTMQKRFTKSGRNCHTAFVYSSSDLLFLQLVHGSVGASVTWFAGRLIRWSVVLSID